MVGCDHKQQLKAFRPIRQKVLVCLAYGRKRERVIGLFLAEAAGETGGLGQIVNWLRRDDVHLLAEADDGDRQWIRFASDRLSFLDGFLSDGRDLFSGA